MSEQNPPRIDELCNRKLLLLIIVSLVFVAACGIAIGYVWHNLDATTHTVILIAFAMSAVTSLVLLVRLALCRLRIDESGVDVDNLLFSSTQLAWSDIRTAAIVHLSFGNQKADPLILLATLAPEAVISRRALTTSRGLAKDEHVRIPLTPARRAAVEHYLHMTLPEYHL